MANVSYLSLVVLSAVAFTSAASMDTSYDSATAQLSEDDAVIQALQCKWIGTAPTCVGQESDCTGDYDHLLVRGACGDGHECHTGWKVLCCNLKHPFSTLYWKGTDPFCGGECSDCGGDTCVLKNHCGRGGVCWSGNKVLCGKWGSLTKAELEEMVKISEYTKAREGMAMLMGGHQVDVMEDSDPGLVLAYVNYDKVIWDN